MPITNSSSSATTIKSMYNLLQSDNWTMDKCMTFCNYDNACVIQDDLILDKYYSYFEQYLIEVTIDKKYFYNPALFALDYYGDAALDFLVLYFAKMTSNFEFNKETITVLDYSAMQDFNRLCTTYKKFIDNNKKNPPVYLSKDISDITTHAKFIN